MPASERCPGLPSPLPPARVLGGLWIDFGKKCDHSDDVSGIQAQIRSHVKNSRHTDTGSELTTTWTYFHDFADQGSFNKPATMRRSDGQWSNTTYQGNPVTGTLVTKTVTGWLDVSGVCSAF